MGLVQEDGQLAEHGTGFRNRCDLTSLPDYLNHALPEHEQLSGGRTGCKHDLSWLVCRDGQVCKAVRKRGDTRRIGHPSGSVWLQMFLRLAKCLNLHGEPLDLRPRFRPRWETSVVPERSSLRPGQPKVMNRLRKVPNVSEPAFDQAMATTYILGRFRLDAEAT